ncbi:endonuclease/exonuclease/phosphatase family protein [Palleronia sp. LCG004]|uniref:endonuclease/exonuclease/phosphatase family protein n=1 Tax=Palleronia sp. LCG004 TaxID=3079304 RepID=UPI002942C672|nr:endonuclease/exonuclease/phosphatase family protein [Palleronia sp. LCG004]WOI56691.1 endonuclease/exonuclease/phosphatase family protein [Palleronia sp. LCG004]
MKKDDDVGLTVASWNVRAGLGRDLKRRPERTIEVISELGADVIVLQEADFRRHPRPSALPSSDWQIAGYNVLPISGSGVGIGWHGIAILFSPSVTIEETLRFDLPALEPRGAVVVTAHIANTRFRLSGVHLGLLRRNRRAQLHFLQERVREMPPCPTILAGDFNEWSAHRGLEPLRHTMRQASPGPSFPAGRPFLSLDRFAWSNGADLVESRVVDTHLTRIASDHRPILGRFNLARMAGSEPAKG